MTNLEQIKVLRDALYFVRTHCDAHAEYRNVITVALAATSQVEAANVEDSIASLVAALQASKGWMRDYADSIIRDAIDRCASVEVTTEIAELKHKLWCAEVNLDGANEHIAELKAELQPRNEEIDQAKPDLSRSFLNSHKIKKYQARSVRIAMEVLKHHAQSDVDSFKALKVLEHNFKDYL